MNGGFLEFMNKNELIPNPKVYNMTRAKDLIKSELIHIKLGMLSRSTTQW